MTIARLIPIVALLVIVPPAASMTAATPQPTDPPPATAESVPPDPTGQAAASDPLAHSVGQLRNSIGRWEVVTEFLNEDGTVAKKVNGTYEFSWVVPDRVVSGRSDIPEVSQSSGILFYVSESRKVIEMASVGADGRLWIMTGPLGGETRTTQEFPTQGGGSAQLRFTRFNITADAFESRMEHTDDGGRTWKPGNHQTFRRAAASGSR